MKLKRFKDNIHENREIYFISDSKKSEEEEKYELIEKISQHWSEKLKQDYLVPRSLFHYSLVELKNIENIYLNEEFENKKPKIFTYTKYDLPDEEDLIDINNYNLSVDDIINGFRYTIIGRGIKDNKRIKMIIDSIKLLSEKYPENKIYSEALKKIKDENNIDENNIDEINIDEINIDETLKELKEQHLSNDAVENIRIEGNEIVFDINCETEVQGTTEYNNISLRYNKLCQINVYDEITEEQILEQIKYWNIL